MRKSLIAMATEVGLPVAEGDRVHILSLTDVVAEVVAHCKAHKLEHYKVRVSDDGSRISARGEGKRHNHGFWAECPAVMADAAGTAIWVTADGEVNEAVDRPMPAPAPTAGPTPAP